MYRQSTESSQHDIRREIAIYRKQSRGSKFITAKEELGINPYCSKGTRPDTKGRKRDYTQRDCNVSKDGVFLHLQVIPRATTCTTVKRGVREGQYHTLQTRRHAKGSRHLGIKGGPTNTTRCKMEEWAAQAEGSRSGAGDEKGGRDGRSTTAKGDHGNQ